MGSNNRRGEREAAVKGFNVLAAELGEDTIKARPSPEDVVSLYKRLGASLPPERRNELKGWRDKWQQNRGDGDFPELLTARMRRTRLQGLIRSCPSTRRL